MDKVDLLGIAAGLGPERRSVVATNVNDSRLRVVNLNGEGTLDKHSHDEFALVLKGRFRVRFGDREVLLAPGEGVLVPRNTEHSAIGEDATIVLFEPQPRA
jgi:mannose-6-phosphate isomerase-like protein (cupin superfamily)